jgi:hypothetical protein
MNSSESHRVYRLWFVYFIIAITTASNIIVLELLKSKINTTVTFTDFLKIGALVGVYTLIYLAFIAIPIP